jgi:phosphatidate cytidylyltransferase
VTTEPPPAAVAVEHKRSNWSLPLRVASGVLFVPLLIVLARAGGAAFVGLILLQAALATGEFHRLLDARGIKPNRLLGQLATLGVILACFRPHFAPVDLAGTLSLLLLLALGLRRPKPAVVEGMAGTLFGVAYVGWLSAHLVLLREMPWQVGMPYDAGASFVLLAFLLTWGCDTAAFLVGRKFGRRRPFAWISPKKTLEGSIGGFFAAVVLAFVARVWFAPYLRVGDAFALGILVGLFAQVGDLVESLLKREARAGDSSDLIPGHGGVLDRFDSLYFGAPVVYYYLRSVVFGAF